MAITIIRSLSIYSALTFFLSLSATWKPTHAQLSENATDDRLTVALGTTSRTLSALGTLTRAPLPTECFSLGGGGNAAAVGTQFQGCDAERQKSCCPDGYSTDGFYYATECPMGYTPRPTDLDTAVGAFSVDRTKDSVALCCPTPNPSSGWRESGFYMSDGLICNWDSIESGIPTTVYNRALASAIVIVMTDTLLPLSTSSAGTSTSGTDRNNSPAETSGSAVDQGGTSSGGMSNGAIIGIAVGVGFPVLAIIGFLIYKFGRGEGTKKEEGDGNQRVEEGGVGGMMY
ncbi:hypothetical protein TWF569_002802 [Orbilia oligospora]|nr:hypothetical protein TWF569_002802 [Orbilia oligospora]